MPKYSFMVGESEKHSVNVNWSKLMKHVRIEVDGEPVVNEPNFSPAVKKYAFEVGETEKHKVEVSAGMLSPLEVIIDGKPLKQHS